MPLAMKLVAPREFKAEDCHPLALAQHEVRVAVSMAGVCGTDLALWSGGYKVPLPLILGHEWVGRVLEVGEKAPPEWLGKRVTGEINNTCLARAVEEPCEACRRGMPSHCLDRTVTGILVHAGAFQRELVVPWRVLHEVPDAMPDEEACFLEPLAAALQTFELTPIQPGDFVVVLGAGRLGCLVGLVAQAMGARVLAVVRGEERERVVKSLALEPFRIPDKPRDPPEDPLAAAPSALLGEVLERTRELGADVVVEATGSPDGLPLALDLVRPRGVIALKSTPGHPVPDFALTRCVVNEVRIQGSRCGPFRKAIDFQLTHRLPLRSLILDTYPLSELKKAFERAAVAPGKIAVRVAE